MDCWQHSGWNYHGSLLSHWGKWRSVHYSCTKCRTIYYPYQQAHMEQNPLLEKQLTYHTAFIAAALLLQ